MSKCLGGIIGCKDTTSSWHLVGFPDDCSILGQPYHVVITFIVDVRLVDAPAGVTHEEGHTGFLHVPSVLRCLPSFLLREGFNRTFLPSSTVR